MFGDPTCEHHDLSRDGWWGAGCGGWIDWVCLAESDGESGCVSVGAVEEEAWF